jgi:hypothetical protein
MRKAAVLTALLFLVSATKVAETQAAEKTHEQKLVEYFVNTPINELPPENVDEFMAVDAQKLPAKLRPKFEARKLELQTLKQLAANKKKGTIRTPEKNCAVPDEAKSNDPKSLGIAGFEEITDSEEHCVMEKTQCTERDMLCEFSLQIVVQRHPKTHKVVGRRLFLYPTDPLMALVGACRSKNGAGGNTNFFGSASVLCSH